MNNDDNIKIYDQCKKMFPYYKNDINSDKSKYVKQILINKNINTTNNKIILDVETNGCIIPQNKQNKQNKKNKLKQITYNKIVQISYLLLDNNNNIIDTINLYLNDGDNTIDYYKKINKEFIKKYGIYPQYILYKLAEDLSKCSHIIGHNIDYDIKCIITHFNKYNIKFTIPEIKYCTMKESKDIVKCVNKLGRIKYPKLSELCEYLKIDIDNKKCHDSLYDINLTYKCYLKLFQLELENIKYSLETPEEIKKIDKLQKEIMELNNLLNKKQKEYIELCNNIMIFTNNFIYK
jgi:DNA polymerase III epsilon subunit-like protein